MTDIDLEAILFAAEPGPCVCRGKKRCESHRRLESEYVPQLIGEIGALEARCDVLADTVEGRDEQIARVRGLPTQWRLRTGFTHEASSAVCADELETALGQPAQKREKK